MSNGESDVLGIVLIGRNEGERLRACIASVTGRAAAVVYVDSGSSDGSPELARAMGVSVVSLDMAVPFTAARARNAGAARLFELAPGVEFVQFIDGDCVVDAGWLPHAMRFLRENPQVAVVCGRRRERAPGASVYNLLCDLEWNTPPGEAREFGGDAMLRASVFRELGGYDPTLIAGEEPEFAVRIRQRGHKVMRLDHEMTLHDAAMTRFSQWWNRTKRSGHALAERAFRHGRPPERDCSRERRSTLVWGLAVPVVTVVLAAAVSPWFLLLLLGYGVIGLRVYQHRRRQGDSPRACVLYSMNCVLAKFPQLMGLLVFHRNRLMGRRSRLIEYKGAAAGGAIQSGPVAVVSDGTPQTNRQWGSMKIAYIVSRYPAISHTFVLREVDAMRSQGFDVSTISIRRADPNHLLTDDDRAEAASTYNVLPPAPTRLVVDHVLTLLGRPLRYLSALRAAWTLRRPGARGAVWALFYFIEAVMVYRHCVRRGVRHLHAHFANVACDVALLATRIGGRGWTYSFTMHGPTEFYALSHHRLQDKAAGARFVVCISDFCRSQLMTLLTADQWAKLRVVHCGVDTASFIPRETRSDNTVTEVLCVGRLVPEKGQAVLLQAASELVARGREVHVTLVGDGPDRGRLESLADTLRLTPHVTFAGAVGQGRIRDFYAAADMFCLASFAEGVPVVLMEAMAMGVPVISTRIMGIPELIDHAGSGLLVSPGRADQLALAMEHLMDSPARRSQIGRNAREKILAEFDLQRSGEQLAGVFREYLEGKQAASRVDARRRGRDVPETTRPTTTTRTGVPR